MTTESEGPIKRLIHAAEANLAHLREEVEAQGTPEEQDEKLGQLKEYVTNPRETWEGVREFMHDTIEEFRHHDDETEENLAPGESK